MADFTCTFKAYDRTRVIRDGQLGVSIVLIIGVKEIGKDVPLEFDHRPTRQEVVAVLQQVLAEQEIPPAQAAVGTVFTVTI